ncbi:condensin subunit Smc [Paraoerskovia marina]|uniref:Chromosome partition protein Smc n=1 Tax=Paraoerskovia marina TaxID=545619 RepID=A0A1H1U3F5_9CELL|nr:chromosome segregation protein SMC [Paraoerskovia marina]SDS66924.1 condensin subunit Smc [Paraoerskovia marina]
MHLKTLTLRGFKSFASATTLGFEPGVTCVVGPNGSGKSNVVDALAWVMGEQGAKSLRGGKMEDVIFAGTAGRPPLGRAEVSLTIDNADGALPIDYSEVTISRTLFRSGGSEYAINGSACRLLDIQDLLSDSGIGREMHVVVGQGQLDAVLRATPEERRGFIEEAAGVLKHRKRKEKALRKLDAMQGNLTRLADLTTEIRKRLGPLGKQAEVARRAGTVQVDVRDARARLLADDVAQATARLEQESADEAAVRAQQATVEAELASRRTELASLEEEAARAAPELAAATDVWFRLSSARERLVGTRQLAGERLRMLGTPEPAHQGQDPDELARQAERVRAAERELAAEVEAARDGLTAAQAARQTAEESSAAADRALATLVRGEADRREGLATLAGKVAARRSRVEAVEAEIGRLTEVVAEAGRRAEQARAEFSSLEAEAAGAEEGEVGLDAAHEQAAGARTEARNAVDALVERRRAAEQERATLAARIETLELSLTRKDGVGELLGADGVRTEGSVAALVGIAPGYEDAVAAALGPAADAVAVQDVGAAVDALRHLRTEDAGRAGLVVLDAADAPARPEIDLPVAASWATDVVTPAHAARDVVAALLRDVVVVEDLTAARILVESEPRLVAVTRGGDVLGARQAWGGSASAPGVLHLQAAVDDARERRDAVDALVAEISRELADAELALAAADQRYDETLGRLDENDAALAAVAERLGNLGATTRGATAEADRARVNLERAERSLGEERELLAALVERHDVAAAEPEASEASVVAAQGERDEAAQAAQAARATETEARLALRTQEERERALTGRAEALDRAVANERQARERAARREEVRVRRARRAREVSDIAEQAVRVVEHSVQRAADGKAELEQARAVRDETLGVVRAAVSGLEQRLRELTDVAHRDEVARAEQRLRIEQLEQRAVDELGLDPAVLVEEFGPHRPVPCTGDDALDEDGEPREVPYVRAEQEKRLRSAERALRALGKVNPLALEEFAALEERHTFLTTQLADLKKSRSDLLDIVSDIDRRVEEVFTSAFADTARQFEGVFAGMFPGGEGRLVLTDPTNMLTTGIEVEARPAGKKVKRLSLLSGGERSLTAVAILVSIFKARPSPFYVMDEVEAALDDVNLGRLLEIFRELQEDSQLIVITHQKRTMEIADALYGVTMRGDGVTTVISQRMDPAPVV